MSKNQSIKLLIAIFILLTAGEHILSQPIPCKKKIMVAYFKNAGFREDMDIFSKGLASLAVVHLGSYSGISVMPLHKFQEFFHRSDATVNKLYENNRLLLGHARRTNCDYIVTGEFSAHILSEDLYDDMINFKYHENTLRLNITFFLTDVKTGKIITRVSQKEYFDDIFDLMKTSLGKLVDCANIKKDHITLPDIFNRKGEDVTSLIYCFQFIEEFDKYVYESENNTMHFNNAKEIIDDLIQIDSDLSISYFFKSILYAKKDLNQAIKYMNTAVDRAPKNIFYKKMLADYYEEKGETDNAARVLEEIVSLTGADSKGSVKYVLELCAKYLKEGKQYKALPELQKSLKADQRNVQIQTFLAYIYQEKNDIENALNALNIAIEEEPHMIISRYMRADIYLQKNLADAAIEDLFKAEEYIALPLLKAERELEKLSVLPSVKKGEILYKLGEAFILKKNYSLAAKYFKRIVKEFRYSDIADKAYKKIDEFELEKY